MTDRPVTAERSAHYWSGHAPRLEVQPGETFEMVTADRFAGLYAGEALDTSVVAAAVGPVAIDGVNAGDTVCIEIVNIEPVTPYGYMLTSGTFGILGDRLARQARRVDVDPSGVEILPGRRVPYRPMIGKLGLAPPAEALDTTVFGDFGGAVSNIHVRPGAALYVRAHHAGGLVFLEDVHAGMGDGEATASAIEMAARVTLRCTVVNETGIAPPAIVTPDEVMTLAQAETLDDAAAAATDLMLELLMKTRGIDLHEAAMVTGAAVDVRIAFMGGSPKKAYAALPRTLFDTPA